MKPCMLKLSSVAEHNANPPIIGIRERFTYIPVFSPTFQKKKHHLNKINRQNRKNVIPVKIDEIITVNIGAELLIVSAKDTGT